MAINLEHLEGRWQPIFGDDHATEPLLFRGGEVFREDGAERVGRYGLYEDELFVQFRPAPDDDATLLHLTVSELEGHEQVGGSEVLFADGAAIMLDASLIRLPSSDAQAER